MSRVRCLIADDEPLAARLLESYAARHQGVEAVAVCTDPAEALALIRGGGIDLAFLDIQMPGMSGMELARAIDGVRTRVIFVTAYADYAVEGFRVRALDYLLKPVSYEEFSEAVRRAQAEIAPETHLTVRSNRRRERIAYDSILCIEALGDYVKIHTTDRPRPVLTQMSLKEMEATLPAHFLRVHRSYIVNGARVDAVHNDTIEIGGMSVRVGESYLPRLNAFLS